jgi:outer membrane protein TolC
MTLRFNRILMLMVAGGISAFSSYSQTTMLTLEDCRQLAVANNMGLKNASIAVDAATEQSKEAFTKYFPSLSASGFGYNANKGLIQMDLGPEMSMSMLKNGILGGITVTQPLFAGGQIVNSNKLAKVGVDVSKLQRNMTENEVLLTVEQYYWQVITLQEKKKTLQTVDDMLKQICSDAETAVNAGIKNRNDLLQAQLKRNDVASSMLDLDNGLSLCRMVLAQYIGMNGKDIDVTLTESVDSVPEFPYDLRVNHEDALLNTNEYKLLNENVKANQLQKKLAVGRNLPTVGIGAGYMYDNLMDKAHPFGVGFLSVSVPISDWWGGSHSIKRAEADVRTATNQLEDSSDLLTINMQHIWNDLENAYQQILIAHNSIDQSTENLRLNVNYYRAGISTMSDLLDAQSLYQQSRDKLVETYSQFKLKELEYVQATGR